MVLYNLHLVLINEEIKVFDNDAQSIVYEGSSEYIPLVLWNELVHDITFVHGKHINKPYLLININ